MTKKNIFRTIQNLFFKFHQFSFLMFRTFDLYNVVDSYKSIPIWTPSLWHKSWTAMVWHALISTMSVCLTQFLDVQRRWTSIFWGWTKHGLRVTNSFWHPARPKVFCRRFLCWKIKYHIMYSNMSFTFKTLYRSIPLKI